VPEATALVVQPGVDERLPFRPRMPEPQAEARDGDDRRARAHVT
jgi:hypothetical protein